MAILSKTVIIVPSTQHIKYYESLGYIIPRYLNKNNNKMMIKLGTTIEIKIEHLLPESNIKVLCKCDTCGIEKMVFYQNIKDNNIYICLNCSRNTIDYKEKISKTSKGRKYTKETRKKMSLSHIGKISPRLGKNLTNETKRKISEKTRGSNNPNYNKNLNDYERLHKRKIIGLSKWKKVVKQRDNYTCQKCKSKKQLCVHHINNWVDFKDQRLNIDNGVTLCFNCHGAANGKSIHNIYGMHPTKEQFNEFMKEY